ncbi:MAG: sulfatase-like hydrolase/transferase [Actinobacteria bacterium]|nr:sulfatase-like hydrolase/transferase [Actinomycetota bacterium]
MTDGPPGGTGAPPDRADGNGAAQRSGRAIAKRELGAFLELLAVTGLAFAQPLFAVFGDAPDQFVFRGATAEDIRWFAAIVLLAPPLACWVVEVVVGLVSTAARRWLHLAFLWAAATAFFVQALRGPLDGWPLIIVAALVGAGLVAAVDRFDAARLWLRFVAIAPPVLAALFVLTSSTAALLDPGEARAYGRPADPVPVVMVVFDELSLGSLVDSDGQIDAALYPNFARLAAGSHWFRNTTTMSNSTSQAVPAILTATTAPRNSLPTVADFPDNLFTLLGSSMRLDVLESITRLCPESLCEVVPGTSNGLTAVLDDAVDVMQHRLSPHQRELDPVAGVADIDVKAADQMGSERRPARFDTFIDGLSSSDDALHFLHVVLPHQPFVQYPDGTRYRRDDPPLDMTWANQTLADLGRQRHLLQTASADRLLGEALDALDAAGTYDDSLVVVVADHGLTFDVGQEIRMLAPGIAPTDRSIADLAWVPFFVKEPGQQGGEVSDADVTTYDVLPTIADVLDVDIPWDHLGRSAFDERTDGRTRTMHVTVQDEIFTLGPTVDVADADRDLLFEHGLDRFFPAVDDPLRWWKRGPYRDLVGTEVAASTGLEPLTVDLAPSSDPDDVDPSTDEVPGLVIGSVPDADPGDAVAVAVDGTIWATTEVWDSGGGPSVAAVVPFDAFVAGTNEVQVLSIEGP